jgi:hypothetical protein
LILVLGPMSRTAGLVVPLATFVLGAGLGVYFGHRIAQPKVVVEETARISRYAAYVDMQRVNGTEAAYEEALRGFLDILSSERPGPRSGIPDRAYAFDAALTYVRLSQLAARRGDADEAAMLLSKASALCPRIGWTPCSESMLVDATKRVGTLAVFGAKTPPNNGPN